MGKRKRCERLMRAAVDKTRSPRCKAGGRNGLTYGLPHGFRRSAAVADADSIAHDHDWGTIRIIEHSEGPEVVERCEQCGARRRIFRGIPVGKLYA